MIIGVKPVTFLLALISAANAVQIDIPPDTPVSSVIETAKSHLAKGSPREALLYFDAAISKDPGNYVTIFQRGAAYLSLGKSSKATEDFDRVLHLKPSFEGALIQRSRIRARTADWVGARKDLESAGKQDGAEWAELGEAQEASILAEKAEKEGDWGTCVSQAGRAILKASTAVNLRRLRAHCRFERGEMQEGINDLARTLQLSPGSLQPHLQMSAMLFYSLADMDRGMGQIRKCLHSDPDSKSCSQLFRQEKRIFKRIQELNNILDKRRFSKALPLLIGSKEETGLLDDVKTDVSSARATGYLYSNSPDTLYGQLVERTCEVYREMNSKRKAKPFCREALSFNPGSLHGLLSKAEEQLESEEFEAAIQTLKAADENHPDTHRVQKLLQKAHLLLRRSKQKDYYKVLEVDREADESTIKRAYRKLTKKYHPDKATSKGISKEEAEKKMASINEAYEVLSNPELKSRFDQGDDPNDPESQHGHPFAGNPFGPGGGQNFFFQGDNRAHFKFSQQGFNFPDGFPFG